MHSLKNLYLQLDVNNSLSLKKTKHSLSNLMHFHQMLYLKELFDFCLDDLTTSCSNQVNESELRRARENVYSDMTTCAYNFPGTFAAQTTTLTRLKNSNSQFVVYYLRQTLPVTLSFVYLSWMGHIAPLRCRLSSTLQFHKNLNNRE